MCACVCGCVCMYVSVCARAYVCVGGYLRSLLQQVSSKYIHIVPACMTTSATGKRENVHSLHDLRTCWCQHCWEHCGYGGKHSVAPALTLLTVWCKRQLGKDAVQRCGGLSPRQLRGCVSSREAQPGGTEKVCPGGNPRLEG